MRVRIFQFTQAGNANLCLYDETFSSVEHYDGDIWLANRDGVETFIRPGRDQMLVIENIPQ